jgi:hypothetical protein
VPLPPASPYQQWCPPALTDAAVPLSSVHRLLWSLCDDHEGVADLCSTSPSPAAREALGRFLDVYAGTAFALATSAGELAYNLRLAAESYRGTEQALHDAMMARSPRTQR